MGIKGIYKEIGQGERISLCKLTTEHFEKHQRPFRLAIDIAIWQFQIQAGKGGSNPAIRTLFYRLARLLGSAIEPIFVFDGPNKPTFKRNKRSGRGNGVSTAMAKRVIKLFGFAIHDAPGEAEAECALLQREGIVDAVLSEDVDTIMFGCGITLRNWSAERTTTKTPTHVTVYDAQKVAAGSSGLDREGMVLVALMSGGDYLPEGVPGCGVKVACQAARAGFGRDLCKIKKADAAALASWKERLLEELRTNKSKHFRTKHMALTIPDDFPNLEVLRYYTHPVVSRQENLDRIRQKFLEQREVNIFGLRAFVAETFDWTNRIGAIKFIRVVAAQILIQRLVRRCGIAAVDEDDLDLKQKQEAVFVQSVTKRREHFSTDATPELRVSYTPLDVVGLNLEEEPEDEEEEYGRQGLALNSDDEFEGEADDDSEQTKTRKKKAFDPSMPDLIWVPESILEMSLPLTVGNWKDKQRAKGAKAAAPKEKRKTTRSKKNDMPVGALDKFVKVTKPIGSAKPTASQEPAQGPLLSEPPIPTASSAPPVTATKPPASSEPTRSIFKSTTSKPKPATRGGKGRQTKAGSKAQAIKPTAQVNPWTIAASPRVTKSTAPSIFPGAKKSSQENPILLSSSPFAPSPTSSPRRSIEPAKTPTRRGKRHSSPSIDNVYEGEPTNPTTSPTDTVAPRQNTNVSSAYTSPEPIRRARPFKRTRSGAENEPQSTVTETTTSPSRAQVTTKRPQGVPQKTAQASIKSFGRTSKTNPLASVATRKPQLVIPPDLFISDEEGDDGDEDPLPSPTRGSLPAIGSRESPVPLDDEPALRGGYMSDDDDPFGPVTSPEAPTRSSSAIPQSCRTSAPSLPFGEKPVFGKSDKKPPSKSSSAFSTIKPFIPADNSIKTNILGNDEVFRAVADNNPARSGDASCAPKSLLGVRSGGRFWRRSDISIIDLTGDD